MGMIITMVPIKIEEEQLMLFKVWCAKNKKKHSHKIGELVSKFVEKVNV